MSMENLNGSYFNGPLENEQWLKEVIEDATANKEAVLKQELEYLQKSVKKYTLEQYFPYKINIELTDDKVTLNPFDMVSAGVACETITQENFSKIFILKGSLLATEDLRSLSEDDLDYIQFLMGAVYSGFKPDFFTKNGNTFYPEFGTLYEKSYLVLQNCWAEQCWSDLAQSGIANPNDFKEFKVHDTQGNEHIFGIEPKIVLVPSRVKNLEITDINGDKIGT